MTILFELKLNSVFSLDYSFGHTAFAALGITQKVEQIMANVFCSTFFKRFYFFHVFTFLTFLKFHFLERFYAMFSPSVSLSSVVCNVCIVAKRYVLPENCLKKQIELPGRYPN